MYAARSPVCQQQAIKKIQLSWENEVLRLIKILRQNATIEAWQTLQYLLKQNKHTSPQDKVRLYKYLIN